MSVVFVALQYVLPKYWLTALVWRIARIKNERVKDFLITKFVALYNVNVDEVQLDVPGDFATFNDFFIRELAEGERPVAADDNVITSPVDGTVSVADTIRSNTLVQAKGIDYTLDDLLATDIDQARAYLDGSFATIYLAPYNYHRVHAPIDGTLVAAHYVPGDLFSVNEATVSRVKGLFRRNERLVMHFATSRGPAALVFVGALNVGSISTPWSGEIRPRHQGVVEVLNLSAASTSVRKGDLLGWFNMGSTVIVLLPKGVAEWHENLQPRETLRMGMPIGNLSDRDE
ncbi:MAG: archaetidylserine decarboxylase [Pseudomonadota bacterium]